MLPAVSVVRAFHHELVAYLDQREAVFLNRGLRVSDRGKTVRTHDGTRVKWTDNAPAWWWHAVLFGGLSVPPGRFADLIDTTPSEWLQVVGRGTLNDFGWHAAHLFNAKDGQTDWSLWSRRTAVWRFVRNIHPCNVFYLPKTGWQETGADQALIASVAGYYRQRYSEIWSEFVDLARGNQTFGVDAPDGLLAIEATAARVAAAPRGQAMRTATPTASGVGVWNEIFQVRSVPPVGELLASHPNAETYTRRLLDNLTVAGLIAITDALFNKCRPSKMKSEAPGDPQRQAELAWQYLFRHARKVHSGSTGWTGAAVLLDPGKVEGLAAVTRLDIGTVAGVCFRIVRGPYTRAVPHNASDDGAARPTVS